MCENFRIRINNVDGTNAFYKGPTRNQMHGLNEYLGNSLFLIFNESISCTLLPLKVFNFTTTVTDVSLAPVASINHFDQNDKVETQGLPFWSKLLMLATELLSQLISTKITVLLCFVFFAIYCYFFWYFSPFEL